MIKGILVYHSIGISLMVFYKEAYVIVTTLIEVLLCTGKRIEVFYFHVFSDRWVGYAMSKSAPSIQTDTLSSRSPVTWALSSAS